MEKKKFVFMETYFETVEELKKHDPELANQLLEAIVQYWLYGIEPENPLIKALLVQIQYMIDTWKEISEKKSTAMKWNKNAVKTYQKQSKQKKTEKNSEEQNETEKTEKENKNKKEKEIILSSNEDKSASTVYWNEEINECLEIIKSFNGWLIDWTQKRNRIYWKNLIGKLKQSPPVINWNHSWEETLKAILQVISENKFYCSKITNPKSIYDNLTLLYQVYKEEANKHVDDIDKAVMQIEDQSLRIKVKTEIDTRRKSWSRLNMEIYKNILDRLSK